MTSSFKVRFWSVCVSVYDVFFRSTFLNSDVRRFCWSNFNTLTNFLCMPRRLLPKKELGMPRNATLEKWPKRAREFQSLTMIVISVVQWYEIRQPMERCHIPILRSWLNPKPLNLRSGIPFNTALLYQIQELTSSNLKQQLLWISTNTSYPTPGYDLRHPPNPTDDEVTYMPW